MGLPSFIMAENGCWGFISEIEVQSASIQLKKYSTWIQGVDKGLLKRIDAFVWEKYEYLCIAGGDESAYQDEVEQLSVWCTKKNLILNTTKTKELIIEFKRKKTDIQPLFISGDCVERVSGFRFLGIHMEDNLTWISPLERSKILKDPSHPGHSLFELLPSGRGYRVLKTRTNRLRNSFYAKAVSVLNTVKM